MGILECLELLFKLTIHSIRNRLIFTNRPLFPKPLHVNHNTSLALSDSRGTATEDQAKRDFGSSVGAVATGIWQAW